MEYYFIINPIAGKVDQSKVIVPHIFTAAKKANIAQRHCHVLTTAYKGHAQILTEEIASKSDPCIIFSVGGDGTFKEVLNGAYRYSNATIGCIPHGSGNDFLRSFGEREVFLDLDAQFTGTSYKMDIMKTPQGVSACICSVGLDAKVAYGIPKFRRIPFCGGSIAYKLSILQCLMGKLGQKYQIVLDDEVLHMNCLMVAVCNGKTYGGGFYAAPEASVTDGLLDVMMVHKINLLRIAKVIGAYQKGKHMQNGKIIPELADIITFRRVKSVQIVPEKMGEIMIQNEDGECSPVERLYASVLPSAAQILLPHGIILKREENARFNV